ncbi:tetratricopeptide repeat protein [Leptothrix discophora]|uniref:Tetratricopeptide repeat protein n=1 Tax=Leptothrix discophora TaxID=89 RepID=A0ABT9G5J4_LEPDI|nr:hypothetical protein [Leptothrix discophora]MDP4301473.1 hypothetical protein [Leptothrix discophora]
MALDVLVLALALALALAGASVLRETAQPPARRAFAVVTLLAAGLLAAVQWAGARGVLVFSPELGVLIVSGGAAARAALAAGLVVTGAAAGLGWCAIRLHHGRSGHAGRLLGIGLLVGLSAAWTVRPLGADEASGVLSTGAAALGVQFLWSPPMLVWTALCAVAIAWIERPQRTPMARATALAVTVAGVGLLPWLRPGFLDPALDPLWRLVAWTAWPLAGGLLLWQAWRQVRAGWPAWRQPLAGWCPGDTGRVAGMALCAVATLALLMWPGWPLDAALAGLLAGLGLTLASLQPPPVHPADPAGPAAGAAPAWAERSGRAAGLLTRALLALLRSLRSVIASFFSASSAAGAVLKALAGVLVLVALSEIPNAGHTVVLPFQTPDAEPFKGSGQALADHVVASLARQNDELLPDLSVLKDLKPADALAARATSQATSTIDAALKKDVDLEFGGVKIPLGALVAPVQAPMRTLLGVRVVSGSLHVNQDAHTLLGANSAGDSWQVRAPLDPASEDCPASAEAATARPMAAAPVAAAAAAAAKPPLKAADVFAPIADELAFRIRRDDQRTASPGMTRSWQAFKCFRDGLRHWRRFELTNGYEELEPAARSFREATRIDPAFALAHYRLGLVMQSDGQPAQAVAALQESLRASPDFLPAAAALATTWWDFDSYAFRAVVPPEQDAAADASAEGSVPADAQQSPPAPQAPQARQTAATSLWLGLVTTDTAALGAVDRASAYYGLCKKASLDIGAAPPDAPQAAADAVMRAYFHCKRGESSFARLPATRRDDPRVRRAEARVRQELGDVLRRLVPADQAARPQAAVLAWHCAPQDTAAADAADPSGPSAASARVWRRPSYQAMALRYLSPAAQVLADDAALLCLRAGLAAATGDDAPMRALASTASAHVNLAYDLFSMRADCPTCLAGAMAEFRTAIRLAPDDVDALNGLAYGVAFVAAEAAGMAGADLPSEADLLAAEAHARRAASLSRDWVNPTARIKNEAVLGEVLLAQGRYHEAVEVLEASLKALGPAAGHAVFHRLRHELVRSALCAADADLGGREPSPASAASLSALDRQASRYRALAVQASEEIRASEQRRGMPVYGRADGAPDPLRLPSVCASRNARDRALDERAVYRLRQPPRIGRHGLCGPQWVEARVQGAVPEGLKLEVLGGGLGQSTPVDAATGRTRHLPIAQPRRESHHQFVATLSDATGRVSQRVWLDTTRPKDDACADNLLTVEFESARPTMSAPAASRR